MSFWFDVLFDEDGALTDPDEVTCDNTGLGIRVDVAKGQVQHWLDRNSRLCDTARKLLKNYADNHADRPPGKLAPIRPLGWNWLPEGSVEVPPQDNNKEKISPVWNPDESDRFEQDLAYGRISREIDTWWLRARDPNYEELVVPMPTPELARTRAEHCRSNLIHRYAHSYQEEHSAAGEAYEEEFSEHGHCPECHQCHHHHDDNEEDGGECNHEYDEDNPDYEHSCDHNHQCDVDHDTEFDADHEHDHTHSHHHDHGYAQDYVDDMIDDDEVDDDESYGDGPLTGLLTEIPNILDPKQIEALHMIIKSCILDNAGSGLTRAGENLQKTRCRMFLALDCGKSLLREMLVFIAVWEKDEQSLIFQVTTQIIEALHHSALIPYAFNCLRISKDIISPAQTVLLRLVNHMFHARGAAAATAAEPKDNNRDIKLLHFFYSFFRSRVVPECTALMHLQEQIREETHDLGDFPLDSWDMDRARDGLVQYLDFLTTVAEVADMRAKLIEWEAVYDLIAILVALEAGVPKKALVELPKRTPPGEQDGGPNPLVERPYATEDGFFPSPPPPPLQEPAHKFAWPGLKAQIFTIIATLLQPPPGKSSPGNNEVQTQMVKYGGIVPLLNCCAYDDHNPFAKERVTLCLKWLLDGCEAANDFFRELVSLAPQPNLTPPPGGTTVSTLRVDGIQGEVKVQVRSNTAVPVVAREAANEASEDFLERTANLKLSAPISRGPLEDDFMA